MNSTATAPPSEDCSPASLNGCAEVYSVKIFMAFEVLEYRTNEMCDVLIEGQRGQPVLGTRGGLRECSGNRELQIKTLVKRDERGECSPPNAPAQLSSWTILSRSD